MFQEDNKGKTVSRLLIQNVWNSLELPVTFIQNEKSKPVKLKANYKKYVSLYGLLRNLQEITSTEVFKINVWF